MPPLEIEEFEFNKLCRAAEDKSVLLHSYWLEENIDPPSFVLLNEQKTSAEDYSDVGSVCIFISNHIDM